jgi:hypothetical protein
MSKNINIPFYNIKPANQIIDILLGKADFAIVNPWVNLPGISKVPKEEFLKIKLVKGNGSDGYVVTSPKIVYKNGNNFTDKINFTEDAGEHDLTTTFKTYGLFQASKQNQQQQPLTLKDYEAKFKVLQKVTVSRGLFKDTNTGLINECIINYQLTQAFELAYLLKIIDIEQLQDNITDQQIIAAIYQKIKLDNSLDSSLSKYVSEYLNFNSPSNLHKYIITYNNKLKTNHRRDFIPSLTLIFKEALETLYPKRMERFPKNQLYLDILEKSLYKNVSAACYVKEYSGTEGGKSYNGRSFYTDYTIKCAAKSTSKTMKISNGKFVPMTVTDYFNMVNIPQIAKIYLTVDFDFRCYESIDKQPIGIRYIIQVIAYKPFEGANNFDSIDVDPNLLSMLSLTDDTNNTTNNEIENLSI